MPITKGKEKEYNAWEKTMKESRLDSSVCLAKWFFNMIDLGRLDIGSIIYNFRHTMEIYEAFNIKNDEEWRIFFSIEAVVSFHEKGEEFRIRWNASCLGENYTLDIENRNRGKRTKYIYNPYTKKQ